MSRDFRDDSSRDDASCGPGQGKRQDPEPAPRDRADRRDRVALERTWSAADRLDLPRTPERRSVTLGRDRVRLRSSESELIATVGAFRAVAVRDLEPFADNATANGRSPLDADVRSLRHQGLLQTHTIVVNGRAERVAVLTEKARDLIENSRRREPRTPPLAPRGSPLAPRVQRFYAGLSKPRELAHDAQLYRMFETERQRLEAEGATVTRLVLDEELKADYQRYVHEQHLTGVDAMHARRAFAEEHDLSFADERIHLPDVRVEYETADGCAEHRDLELATEHYSRSQLGGKVGAGFRVYRAAGAGGGSRRGGATFDPHHLEWIA